MEQQSDKDKPNHRNLVLPHAPMDSCLKITLCIDKEIDDLEKAIDQRLQEERRIKLIEDRRMEEENEEGYTPNESFDRKEEGG